MIKTFESFLAAVIVFATLLYFSPNITSHSTMLSIQERDYKEVYGCNIFSGGEGKLIILELNESIYKKCVSVPIPYNRTYAFYNGKLIPSGGGNNITIEIYDYQKGDPIFVYVFDGPKKNLTCNFPVISVGYNYLIEDVNVHEFCGDKVVVK